MRPLDRYDLNIIIEKLDRNHCSLAYAKTFVKNVHGMTSKARNKEAFIRELCQHYREHGIAGAC